MTICDSCFDQLGTDSERFDDEILCGACAEKRRERDADYESVMATWREKEPT